MQSFFFSFLMAPSLLSYMLGEREKAAHGKDRGRESGREWMGLRRPHESLQRALRGRRAVYLSSRTAHQPLQHTLRRSRNKFHNLWPEARVINMLSHLDAVIGTFDLAFSSVSASPDNV